MLHKKFYRLIKCGISEIFNLCVLNPSYRNTLNADLFNEFNRLIKIFVATWNRQEHEAEIKMKESESLYKVR